MHLHKIDVYGFKSFAEKIQFELGAGITAIVGPNGSGKSNITEAIRWVLGEQSAKTLRGIKMEDIIFSGSAKRKPLGIAEVSLTLNNDDHSLPLEFNEVTITRRVFRSGESEFYINKVPCRLKDIHDLLSGTGLGKDSFSIIGQNKIDEILNSKSEDRRAIFDEAAGITRFKNRKRDALRKLEETDANLQRLYDILSEIETQIDPLQASAAKAKVWQELNRQLSQTDVTLLALNSQAVQSKLTGIVLEQENWQDKQAHAAAQIARMEAEQESFQLNTTSLEQQCAAKDNKIYELSNNLERLEGQKAVLQERVQNLDNQQQRYQIELTGLQDNIKRSDQILSTSQLQLQQLDQERQQNITLVQHSEQKLEQINHQLLELERNLDGYQEQAVEHVREIAAKQNELQSLKTEGNLVNRQRAKVEEEQVTNEKQRSEVQKESEQLNHQLQEMCTEQRQCQQEAQDAQQQKQQLTHKRERLLLEQNGITQTVQSLRSRLKILTDMQQEYEGFGHGVKAVLAHRGADWHSGICGVIAELIDVPSQYVIAIETALGGAMQNIVTENSRIAKNAIDFLKQQRYGRATFLPLDTVRPFRVRDNEIILAKMPGAVGFAIDLVHFDSRYHSIINNLLGRIIIARNLDSAMDIAKKSSFSFRIVTLDGDVVHPGGSLTGGSRGKKEIGFLSRGNEINELRQLQQDALDKLKQVQDQVTENQNQLRQVDSQCVDLQNRQQQIQLQSTGLQKEIQQRQQEITRLEHQQQIFVQEQQNYMQILDHLREQQKQLMQDIEQLEDNDQLFHTETQSLQQQITTFQNQKVVTQQQFTEYKIAAATLEHRYQTCCTEITRLEAERQALQENIITRKNEISSLQDKRQELLQTLTDMEQQRQQMINEKMEQEAFAAELRKQRYSLLEQTVQIEKTIKEQRRLLNNVQQKLHSLELLAAQCNFDLDNMVERLQQQYRLTIEQAQLKLDDDHPDIAALESNLQELKIQIEELGPVNLAAIDEYDRLNNRYHFLQAQQQDLAQAKQSLCKVIEEMDSIMKQRFSTAFHAIKGYFSDVFSALFGGGQADLVLTDHEDLLNTGVDIIAQPPGKKLQNMMLLSGGERTLTVIALLFAILSYQPTPFCVMDEIDAALDESNVRRFARFLREFAMRSQFIVVTHRKGTMEAADVMHGITMEESGISKLVSVKLVHQAS